MIERELLVHERTLSSFYGSFPYPWRPHYLDCPTDPSFHTTMIRHETGRFDLADVADIWVAGCGTNQALITALRFPSARVRGTDVSARSLEICADNARKVGVSNLELAEEPILACRRESEFDLVISTGVIHHNPDPEACLARLAAALRPGGVLELMVYNKAHRREPQAFQDAVAILLGDDVIDEHDRLHAARSLASALRVDSALARMLGDSTESVTEAWADTWLNPCEHSYDVAELWSMAQRCHLTVEAPHVSQHDKASGQFLWSPNLADARLLDQFYRLTDRERWQAVNLLHLDVSPMLWFYLRPDPDGTARRVTDAERDERFLDSVLSRPTAARRRYVWDGESEYQLARRVITLRDLQPPEEVRDIWQMVDGRRTAREIFAALGRSVTPHEVYRARAMLATEAFPHVLMSPA